LRRHIAACCPHSRNHCAACTSSGGAPAPCEERQLSSPCTMASPSAAAGPKCRASHMFVRLVLLGQPGLVRHAH
jgi:hypothetical protein